MPDMKCSRQLAVETQGWDVLRCFLAVRDALLGFVPGGTGVAK